MRRGERLARRLPVGTPLRLARTEEEFFADPAGRYVVGDSYVYWCRAPGFYGSAAWGRPDEAQVRRLVGLWEMSLRPDGADARASLVDLRGVEGVDPHAYQPAADFFRAHDLAARTHVTRQAIVRPAGFAGALVAGFREVVATPYAARVFADAAEALAWLGRPAPADELAWLDALYDTVRGSGVLLASLREVLLRDLTAVSLAEAAAALRLSARTLQRRLSDAETTFQAEVDAARVAAAQALLLRDGAKVTAVAVEVGCASSQHFSTLFRRVTGLSPSDWRAQRRAEAP